MRGPCAVLLLSAGELGATHRDSATWYRQEGGPVCSWLRKPQPREPLTSFPVSWTWARHSESRPPGTLPWPGPASALPDRAHAGGKRSDGSPASARSLGGAFESLAHSTHTQGATELRPLGQSHPSALDDALPQDGEAHLSWRRAAAARARRRGGGNGGREKSDRERASRRGVEGEKLGHQGPGKTLD